jgi:hypothetical protein
MASDSQPPCPSVPAHRGLKDALARQNVWDDATEDMPDQARLLAVGVEWQRLGGRLKPKGDRG